MMKKILIIAFISIFSNIIIAQEPLFGLTVDVSNFSTTWKTTDYSFSIKVVPPKSTVQEYERIKEIDDTQYLDKYKEVNSSIGYVQLGDFILCTITSTETKLVMNIWIRVPHDMSFYDEIKLLDFNFIEGTFFYDMLSLQKKFAANIKSVKKSSRIKYEINLTAKGLQSHRLSNYEMQNIVLSED